MPSAPSIGPRQPWALRRARAAWKTPSWSPSWRRGPGAPEGVHPKFLAPFANVGPLRRDDERCKEDFSVDSREWLSRPEGAGLLLSAHEQLSQVSRLSHVCQRLGFGAPLQIRGPACQVRQALPTHSSWQTWTNGAAFQTRGLFDLQRLAISLGTGSNRPKPAAQPSRFSGR